MNSGIGRSSAVDSLKDESAGASPQGSNEWLAAVLAASRDGIVVETNERIVEVNHACVRLLGYASASELVGRPMSILGSPCGIGGSNTMQGADPVIPRGEPELFVFVARRKDGTLIQLEATTEAAALDGNSHRIMILRDLTTRTSCEAQKLEAVGQLTKSVAHDLNNLLTAIRCQTELVLVYEAVPPTVREMLQKVITATDRATELTRQLLSSSRRPPMPILRSSTAEGGQPTTADLNASAAIGGNETLLVVADDHELRQLIRLTLQKLGYQVLEAASGVETLKVWGSHSNDIRLALTEMLKPEGLGGYELIKRLRAEKPELKAIVMSDCAIKMPEADLVLLRGVRFLSRPFDPLSLAHMIRSCLDETHGPAGDE